MKKSRDLLINVPPTSAPRTIQKLSISAWQYASNAIEGSRPLARRHVQRRPLRDAPCGPSRPNPIARRQAQGFSKCVTEAHQGCRRKLSVRSDYRKSACSVFCDVCFALQNGLKSGIARCMKSANNGRSTARCDRPMIAASIRTYALVARGHLLRRDGRRRKRRAGHLGS
jgi:hypothetical protein